MAVMFLALRTDSSLPQETLFFCFWYSILLEAEWTTRPSAVGKIWKIEKKLIYLVKSQTSNFQLVALGYRVPLK
jgi:hypothetical protein